MMNTRRLSKGLIILYIGVIILLSNLDIIQFSWWYALSFWPLLLVLVGVNMLLPEKPEGQILSVMATLIVLAFFTYQGLYPKKRTIWSGIFNDSEMLSNGEHTSLSLSEPMDKAIKQADLSINAGAIDLKMGESTDKLVVLKSRVSGGGFQMTRRGSKTHPELEIEQRRHEKRDFRKDASEGDRVHIGLNRNVLWHIDFKLGAANADLDLREFDMSAITLNCGVSSVKLQIGMPAQPVTDIVVEGGLASIEMAVPKEAGCRIRSSVALSSLDAPGFIKQDGFYVTENYAGRSRKIDIQVKSGLSSIDIKRY